PLKVLYSPYREIIRPIVEYTRSIRDANPRGVVAVYIPEYVVGRWWEQVLHNQTALRLKGRLLFTPGVMVTSVPYQLHSSVLAKQRAERAVNQVRAGDVRRGETLRQPPKGPDLAGRRLTVETGNVGHGGFVVARHEGVVVFVRHALPGEWVVAEVT